MGAHSGPSPSNDFRYNSLLLSGNGVNGAQNNTFMDSTAPGGYAVNFKGSPDGIYYDYGSTTHSYWNNDFTIEFWINTAQSTGIGAIFESWYDGGFGGSSYGISISSGVIGISSNRSSFGNSGNFITSGSTLVSDGAWHHVAITQTTGASKTFRLFVDGVMRGYKVETNWTQGLSSTYIYIGEQGPGTYDEVNRFFIGLLSNLRLVTSVVPAYVTSSTTVGTTIFTPPSAPLSAISNTSVLLCQSSTFVDNGPSAKTISVHGTASVTTGKILTRTGNVAQGTFSPFSLAEGQWSNHFLKSSNSILTTTNAAIAPNTGDFSMECWLLAYNNTSTIHIMSIGQGAGSGRLFLSLGGTTGRLSWNQYGSGAQIYTASNLINIGTWYHVVVTRASGYMRIFVDGVLQGAGANTDNYTQTTYYIGGIGTETFDGYLSNVRYLNGSVPTAYQTTSTTIGAVVFTPPTSALTAITGTTLLTCQSNRFKDNSSNNFTITPTGDTKVTAFSPFEPGAPYISSINGGSAYFDGSGDYLTTPSDPALNLGTGDFTLEAWVYRTASTGGSAVINNSLGNGDNNYFFLGYTTAGKIYFEIRTSSGSTSTLGDIVGGLNSWVHIAVTRQSGTVRTFVNGVLDKTITITSACLQRAVYVGGFIYPGWSEYFPGYISNARIVKDTALYTSNFTPSTSPLTSITNTSLLLNFTNAGIYDSTGKNDIETVGNAQISTSVKKYGTGSMYFDGTGDWLTMPSNDTFNFGSGDFTVEFWIRFNSINGAESFIGKALSQQNRANIAIYQGKLYMLFIVGNVTKGYYDKAWSPSVDTWYHLAFVRTGSTGQIYINGVSQSATTNTAFGANDVGAFSAPLEVGYTSNISAVAVNGYIDDLRITKGLARYTQNFDPPSYPLKLR